jgi:hypothetical protein
MPLQRGEGGFKLPGLLSEKKSRKKSWANGAHESHGEAGAEQLAVETLAALRVSSERKDLEWIRK